MNDPAGRWEDGLYLIDDEAWLPSELCQRCQAEPIGAGGLGSRCLRAEYPTRPVRHRNQAEYLARPEVKVRKAEYRARPEVKARRAVQQAEWRARPEIKARQGAQPSGVLARLQDAFGGDPS